MDHRFKPPSPLPPPPQLTRTTTANILLNKYELGKLLGRGSFAKVYAATSLRENTTNDNNNKQVAIKVIDKTRADFASMEPRVICEIMAMKRLQHHPNVLQIHEVMATKTKIFLVMELAAAGDLFSKILQRGKLKETTARRVFQQLVSALNFCHQNGVAHRDLKPQNLLLDENGNLKVSDFGLSTLAEASINNNSSNSVLHTACGTPAFAAPEVMARQGYDGAKADAWSCGVILFFLLSNCLPFDDSNLLAMYKKIHKRVYQIPSYISKSAKSVITQLLDPNPDTRMSIEALMSHPWFVKKLETPIQKSLFEFGGNEMMTIPCYNKFDGGLSVNAFDIISFSSGLDLSGLFEVSSKRYRKRFTSREKVEDVREKVKEVGGRLGYSVEEGKGGEIGLGKLGRLVLVFEVLAIAERLLVVEVKFVEGGASGGGGGRGGVELEEVYWKELEDGLGDVLHWQQHHHE